MSILYPKFMNNLILEKSFVGGEVWDEDFHIYYFSKNKI